MKTIVIFILTLLTFSVNGQIEPLTKKQAELKSFSKQILKKHQHTNDSIPFVKIMENYNEGRLPAVYINGEFSEIINVVDSKQIDSISIAHENIEIKGQEYYGKIYIMLKKEYTPKLISLNDLKEKHTELINEPVIFMVDNEFIKKDYDNCLVDENYIHQIVVDEILNEKEGLNINILHILTKTEENIKKSKEIRIRGMRELTAN